MKTCEEDRFWWRNQLCDAHFFESYVVGLLLDDIDTLKTALEQVEWIPFYTSRSGIQVRCPWCGLLEVAGHGPLCPRQLALKEEGE